MKRPMTLALAASLGAAYEAIQNERASAGDAVRVRFTLPFGQTEADREAPRVAFGFAHDFGQGQMSNLDLVSFSLTGDTPRVETPFRLNANGDGSPWYTSPTNWLLVGAGVAVAWAVYDHNQDDDNSPPPPPPPS
jgi:hypothetical protein